MGTAPSEDNAELWANKVLSRWERALLSPVPPHGGTHYTHIEVSAIGKV